MYRKDTASWTKHVDFILLDMLCLQIAFVLAFALSGYGVDPYSAPLNRNMALIIEVIDVILVSMFGTMKNVLKRGYYRELVISLQHDAIVGLVSILYLYVIHRAGQYSRLFLVLNIVIYAVLSYISRCCWKSYLRKGRWEGSRKTLLLVTSEKNLAEVIKNTYESNYARYILSGVAVIDTNMKGREVEGLTVVADREDVLEYACQSWIDEVLIVLPMDREDSRKLAELFTQAGIVVHQALPFVAETKGRKKFIENIGKHTVLTTSINYASERELFLKRLMDIVGGLIGCIFTGILFIFIGPAIYIASPGPILFKQERVGKNGKHFTLYKFRSMYMDAEKRKAELLKDNKLGDGKMFKLDFDPRVIGNKILPDGTKKTGIGEFIRKTSIDEFPQFFNVLKGEMSLVGTRPPLISETQLYETHHRARLAIKPGITGLWQISGRSNITDFEEVVRLDREYIENWNLGLDIKILFKTVKLVLKKDGAV